MTKTLKRAILRVSKGLGLTSLVAHSGWRQNRLAILCYHCISIDDEHLWDPRLYVSPERLEQRFESLQRGGYRVLPLEEAVSRLYAGALPPKSVALTFDDGTYDFYAKALPLLRKYGFPATVYLTTFYCYHPHPVFEMFCHYLVWKGRDSLRRARLLDLDFTPDLSTESGRTQTAAAVVARADSRGLSLDQKDALARELAGQLHVDYEEIIAKRILRLMTPDEIGALPAHAVDVQLHTHRHRTPLQRDLFAREISDNRRCIQAMTGSEHGARHFCYPNGVYAPEFLTWLEEQDVVSSTTCVPGLASPRDHRLLLPRIVDTNTLTAIEWEAWLVGISELAAWRQPARLQ